MKIVIKSRYTNAVMHEHNAESFKEAVIQLVKDGADLYGADLRADLRGADLRGANLRGATLRGAKNYSENHDIFCELIKRQNVATFTTKEWECIAHIYIHRICWDTILKRFSAAAMRVFKKLAKVGYDEYLTRFKEESQ